MRMTFRAALIALMLVPTGTLAQDFDEGLSAFQEGDYWTAFRNWHKLAGEGNMHAQNNLGWMYEKGFGVVQNYEVAELWYYKAAQQGLSKAQDNLSRVRAYTAKHRHRQ